MKCFRKREFNKKTSNGNIKYSEERQQHDTFNCIRPTVGQSDYSCLYTVQFYT